VLLVHSSGNRMSCSYLYIAAVIGRVLLVHSGNRTGVIGT